jgi:hypothetical protein
VFVAPELSVDVGLAAAQARLTNLLRDGRLAQASHAAYAGEGAALMRVGPAGAVPGASKLVKVLFLDPVYRCDSMRVAIRWEATGPAGSLFPLLDADISLTSAGGQVTRLALEGAYRPPFGRLGGRLDRAILHRVATATMRALLAGVAEALASPAPAPVRQTGGSRWPVPETGAL